MSSRFRPHGRVVSLVCLTLASTATLAGPTVPKADLAVTLEAPPSVDISRPNSYLVTVINRGPQTSATITARVTLPLSNTSPQVFPLGTVSGLDSRCKMVNNALSCTLAGLRKGWSTTFSYTYAAPVSTKTLQMTASASSATVDPVAGNNSASVVPNLVYPSRPITSANITTRLCTGTGLTSFFECAAFPSSIMSWAAALQANGSIVFSNTSYTGTWSQNSARTSLKMELFDNSGAVPVKVSEFNGWAINGANCFHGMTTHTSSSTYVSPYEVCMP
jgi:Domain of unknown function DUF11